MDKELQKVLNENAFARVVIISKVDRRTTYAKTIYLRKGFKAYCRFEKHGDTFCAIYDNYAISLVDNDVEVIAVIQRHYGSPDNVLWGSLESSAPTMTWEYQEDNEEQEDDSTSWEDCTNES